MNLIQDLITKNSYLFDPINLLLVLTNFGYDVDDILFRSHFNTSSQARLIVSVEFKCDPKKVIITLNIGLLGGQGLLPNYFYKEADKNFIENNRFSEFFSYFDDRLLRRFLLAIYPEFNQAIYPNWDSRKESTLKTLKLDNLTNLHWLVQLIFPELQVRVEKAILQRSINVGSLILGKIELGYQAVFGKIKKIAVLGRRITLISDEDRCNNKSWPEEIDNRLHNLVLPILQGIDVDLEIWLVIRFQSGWLSLKDTSYLGYENIVSDKNQVRKIKIFSGHLNN